MALPRYRLSKHWICATHPLVAGKPPRQGEAKIYGKEKQKEYFPAIPFHIFIDLSNYLIMKKRDPAETGLPPM